MKVYFRNWLLSRKFLASFSPGLDGLMHELLALTRGISFSDRAGMYYPRGAPLKLPPQRWMDLFLLALCTSLYMYFKCLRGAKLNKR